MSGVIEKQINEEISEEQEELSSNTIQVLTFYLDEDLYGIEITQFREVLEYKNITEVPGVPDYMNGVINLRGMVVPIMDLRMKFKLHCKEIDINTNIIILNVDYNGVEEIMGGLVDAIHEVVEIPEDNINQRNSLGTKFNNNYIRGMGNKDDTFFILLDVNNIFIEDINE